MVNIAKYYYYKTVHISKQNNDVFNIHKGLDIIKVINYKLKDLIMLLRLAKVKISIRKGQNFNKKRLSSYTNAPLLLSKYIYLGSPPKGKRYPTTLNQVH